MSIRNFFVFVVLVLSGCASSSEYLTDVRAADAIRDSGRYAQAADEYENLAIKYATSRSRSSLMWLRASQAWEKAGNADRAQRDHAMWEAGLNSNTSPSYSPQPVYAAPAPAPQTRTANTSSRTPGTAGAHNPPTVSFQLGSQTNGQSTERDPFVYDNSVNNCLITEPNPAIKGTSRWRNQCSFKINIIFCSVRSSRNECTVHMTGSSSLAPGATTYLLRDERSDMFIACKDPYYLPSTKLTWSGQTFSGRCQKSR